MIKSTFEIYFQYGSTDECLYEVSAFYSTYHKELVIDYIYNLETAKFEDHKKWNKFAEQALRKEIIMQLKSGKMLADLEFNN